MSKKLSKVQPRLSMADDRLAKGGSWRDGLTTAGRGYDYGWKKMRDQWIDEHPLCVRCDELGVVTAATVVDHIIPHRGDRALRLNWGNLQSLCKACHDGWKQRVEKSAS